MKIFERAMELIADAKIVGLGSGRAAHAFVRLLGERQAAGEIQIHGVATSESTAKLAKELAIPLQTLADVEEIDVTVDGADEVSPKLDLIKGYGRAMVREKIIAASSRKLIILVGDEKIVPQLGSRGKLPIEVLPFAIPLVERRLRKIGLNPVLYRVDGAMALSDNGNAIFDCQTSPIENPKELEEQISSIPGIVGSGLFLQMASTVLVGNRDDFEFQEEMTADS